MLLLLLPATATLAATRCTMLQILRLLLLLHFVTPAACTPMPTLTPTPTPPTPDPTPPPTTPAKATATADYRLLLPLLLLR